MATAAAYASSIESSLEDWLPITASRNAKWWYSAFHNVTAIVGAGVLSFPIAMKYLDWSGGGIVIGLSWAITLFTMWELVEMHETREEVVDGMGGVVVVRRRRFDRYHELAQEAFGHRLGLWIVIPQQIVIEVGVDIVYMLTGGQSLMKFTCVVMGMSNDECYPHDLDQRHWILIFASIHFFLAQLPSFNSLALVSFVAAAMSLSYSTIAWIAILLQPFPVESPSPSPSPSPNPNPNLSLSPSPNSSNDQHDICYPDYVGVLNALGQIAFAYASHNVALEIQATIPSTPNRPSKKPMMQGVLLAYLIVAICYFPVAFVGRHRQDIIGENILIALENPRWLIAIANFMVFIHMIGSYQLYAMPVFDMLETVLVKVLHFRPTLQLRLIVRSIYVAFTLSLAIAFPFFQALLGLFGGFAFTPLTYFIPCIIWFRIRKQKLFSFLGLINFVCIILGVLLMISSTIGAIILLKYNTKAFSFAPPRLPKSTQCNKLSS